MSIRRYRVPDLEIEVLIGPTTPTVGDGIAVGMLWIDTSSTPDVKKCTSVSPPTFLSIEGGGGGSDNQVVVFENEVQVGSVSRRLNFGDAEDFTITEDGVNNWFQILLATVGVAKGGTGADLSGTGGAGQYVRQSSVGAALTVGTIPAGDLPSHNHNASDINAGTLGVARGGTGLDGSATGGANQVVKQSSLGGAFTVATLTAAEVPTHNHDTADINTGTLALARGGVNADLSATGGAGQVLKQTSAGANITVAAILAGDLPTHNHNASDINAGTLGVARGGTGLDGSGTGGANQFVKQLSVGGAFSVATITAGNLPTHNHAAGDINTGQLALARGGTNADLSATGGANQVLKQSSAGANISVAALLAADIPAHAITTGHNHSGGTDGRFMRETGATTFAFETIIISRGGTLLDPTGARNVIVWRATEACTVTNVRGYRVGGTGATINARRNNTDNHLASALSVTSASTWMDGGAVSNTAYVAGDELEIMVVTVAGSPTEVAIQVEFTVP